MLWSDQIYKAPVNSGEVLLGRTLPSLLDEACSRYPNSNALNQWTETGWQSLSHQEFQSAIEEVALGLLDFDLEKGDRIALLMHNDVNFCIADMGSLLAGLVDVPIDLTQTLEHIIFILRHAEAKVLIISNLDLLYQVVPYLWDTPELKVVIIADVPADWQQIHSQILTCQLSSYREDKTQESSIETECLCIPKFFSQANLERPCPEFPQCIQVFSLSEVRARGRTLISEGKQQQLRSIVTANDLATIIYIPGAKGEPLGVMLTHENLSANALAIFTGIPNLEFGAKEVILSFLPLTHVFARVLLYGHINYGHSIYLTTPNRVIRHLKEVQPTIFATVPLLLEKIYNRILEEGSKRTKLTTVRDIKNNVLSRIRAFAVQTIRRTEQPKTQRFRLSSLRLGAHLSPLQWKFPPLRISVSASQLREIAFTQRIYNWALNLAKQYELGKSPQGRYALMLKLADRLVFWQWRAVFGGRLKYLISGGAPLKAEIANLFGAAGIIVLQGYGLTETSSAFACTRGQFNRAGTVGVPMAGVEVAIADDGEILTRSPYITQGYYKNPEATQQLIDADGWLHTGDLGEITDDGLLKITGLKKSRFKLSTGKYVTPEPLESKLEQSPLVAKAVAVGAERKFCAMLIFPNLDNLRSYALSAGIDLPTEALLKHPCIIAMYQALVDEANCHLPQWSTVKRFRLIDATLTVENGTLTPTQEVRRAKVAEVFAEEIAAIYEDTGTHNRGNAEIENIDQQDTSSFSCPPIPQPSCPAIAQSLNT
ncbi:AMP-dependent synthetase/ligase [Fischerella sp. PCC 9605]|uniref:AMP-dependent synthetase/ligase n=1 Tax=Fischerella sp. PCC 9605 TaxID=1173024 RepID=UPI00047BFD79|nr:AMP-binding protein [Fischerella sp. PCC 9605]